MYRFFSCILWCHNYHSNWLAGNIAVITMVQIDWRMGSEWHHIYQSTGHHSWRVSYNYVLRSWNIGFCVCCQGAFTVFFADLVNLIMMLSLFQINHISSNIGTWEAWKHRAGVRKGRAQSLACRKGKQWNGKHQIFTDSYLSVLHPWVW